MMEQPRAVRDGVVDMVYSACAFYAAQVPECDAMSASTLDGPTARKNGGTELLNQIHQKRAGVYLLGWVDSGIRFNLWSTKEPKLDSTGHIDIKGFKVRGHPIYQAFLTNYLGAQTINVNSPDLYTALERGTVEMSAWTQIGLMDLNWDRYLKYRILPDFFSTDLVILVNLKKWNALAPKTREILQRVAIQHETESLQALQKLWKEEEAELKKRGIKTVEQSARRVEALLCRRALGEPRAHEGTDGEVRRHGKLRQGRPALHPVLMKKAYDAVLYGMAWCAGVLIAAMMIVITVDVVVRNLGYQSSGHFFTFTEYALLLVPCLGAPWLVREKGHVYVEILLMHLEPARPCAATSGDRPRLHRGLRGARLARLRPDAARLRREREGRALARHAALDAGRLHSAVVRHDGGRVPALPRPARGLPRKPDRAEGVGRRWSGTGRPRCSSAWASAS